jgi:hypothetical protein
MSLGGEHLSRAMARPDDGARRKTIVGEMGADKENAAADDLLSVPPLNTPAPGEKPTAAAATTTASHMKSSNRHHYHHHQRLQLPGSVSDYYFGGQPKTDATPFGKDWSAKKKKQHKSPGKAQSAKKKLDAALREESDAGSDGGSSMLDESFDNSRFARYDGSVGAAETSFLSTASSSTADVSSNSSSSNDMLNHSVLSDTTELTPANFILQARSRQFVQSNNKQHARDAADAAARSSKAASQGDKQHAASHQDKESMKTVDEMEEAEPQGPSRPPLPAATGKDRRKTLESSSFFQLTQASEMDDATPSSSRSRRETLLGPIPGGSAAKTDEQKVIERSKHLLSLAAQLKEKGEKRKKDRESDVRERLSTGSTMSLNIPQSLLGGGSKPTAADDDADSSTAELPVSRRRTKEPIDDDSSTALDLPTSLLAAVAKPPGQKRLSDDGSTISATFELPQSLLGAATKPTAKRTVAMDDSSTMELRPSFKSLPMLSPFSKKGAKARTETGRDSLDLSFGSLFDDMTGNPSASGQVAGRASEIEERDAYNIKSPSKDGQSKRHETSDSGPTTVPDSISIELSTSSIAKRPATTPTRLKGSPRRLSQKNAVNSPARNADVPASTHASPARKKNMHLDTCDLAASPAQNTRSKSKLATPDATKRKHEAAVGGDDASSPGEKERPGSEWKRHKSSAFKEVGKKLLGAPQSSRKSTRLASARKTVIFGSPEAAEYNIGSPATSMTPMLSSRAKARYTLPDDTAEIEADMNAMFRNGRISLQTNNVRDLATTVDLAPRVPEGQQEGMQPSESNDHSDMEMDSSSTSSSDGPIGDSDPTEELEACMADLLNGAGSKKARRDATEELESNTTKSLNGAGKLQESLDEPDQTEELESDLADILNGRTVGNEQGGPVESDHTKPLETNLADILNGTVDNQSQQLENEPTEELESQLEDMLDGTDDRAASVFHTSGDDKTRELEGNMRDILESNDSPSAHGSSITRRNSRKSSRRFSICPKSRLSLSADGSVLDSSGMFLDPTEGELDHAMPASQPEEITPVLDLKVDEILAVTGALGNLNPLNDILVEIGESVRDCATADVVGTINDCLKSVCEKVESTIPEIDPNLFSNMQDDEQKAVLALQVALRSNQSESVKKALVEFSSFIGRAETQEFCSWFVNVAEQLHSHILTFIENTKPDQERNNNQAELLDKVEGILAEMESHAVRRARRESFERRKVSFRVYLIVDKCDFDYNIV